VGRGFAKLERQDLLLGDLALIDRILDVVRRDDVAHQCLQHLNPLLLACFAQLALEFMLELELGVAADEIARGILAADEPAERSRIRQDHFVVEIRNQLAAAAVLHIEQRQLVGNDGPFDESLHLDVEAVAGGEHDRVIADHLEPL
jgi:hypothetical protein